MKLSPGAETHGQLINTKTGLKIKQHVKTKINEIVYGLLPC